MELAETVTFGGGLLDRAANLREDESALSAALSQGDANVLALWQGKPLMQERAGGLVLTWLENTHPALRDAGPDRLFLGLMDGNPIFAADISNWRPDEVDQEALGSFLDTSQQAHPLIGSKARFQEIRLAMTQLTTREAEIAATAKAMLAWHSSHRFCAKCGTPSDFSHAGWHRSCPGCGTQHFPRTDPVVIMLITHGNDVLLGRSPHWPEGMYSLLAGFVEPGETLEAAVRREVLEEANIKVGPVEYLSSQPWPYPMSLMFGCRGEAQSREITIDPVEIEDALWISREEAAKALDGRHPTILPARKGSIAQFLLQHWVADRLK